jgi:hypothetical protein
VALAASTTEHREELAGVGFVRAGASLSARQEAFNTRLRGGFLAVRLVSLRGVVAAPAPFAQRAS